MCTKDLHKDKRWLQLPFVEGPRICYQELPQMRYYMLKDASKLTLTPSSCAPRPCDAPSLAAMQPWTWRWRFGRSPTTRLLEKLKPGRFSPIESLWAGSTGQVRSPNPKGDDQINHQSRYSSNARKVLSKWSSGSQFAVHHQSLNHIHLRCLQ